MFDTRNMNYSMEILWEQKENECTGHNISEAFRLFKEAENERERKVYARYIKTAMEEIHGPYGSKPLTWKKEWDVG